MALDDSHLRAAIDAAEEAAAIHRRNLGAPGDIAYKARSDLVTAVDEEAERVVTDLLNDQFPDHVLLGEESGQDGEGTHRWIVDPLDGTTNYCHGIPHYGVSIAFERRGVIEAGVVHHTPTGETYAALRDEGAYWDGTRFDVSSTDTLSESLLGTGFAPGTKPDEQLFDILGSVVQTSHGVRRFGSATFELISVANGTLDGYYRTGLAPWDTAAALLIVEEAGGMVTDFRGSNVNRRETILATNGEIHGEIEELIQVHMDDGP